MRVIVTDASASAAVACVRSLGRRGVTCLVAWQGETFPLAATSRYCAGVVRVPDPLAWPARFADALLRLTRRREADALIPISDGTRVACAPRRSEIEENVVYCAAPEPALDACSDKWSILEAGRRAGVGVPPAWLVRDPEGWRVARREIGGPAVVRSRRSLIWRKARLLKPRSEVFFKPERADSAVASRLREGESLVVTPYREGTGRGIYLFMAGGRVVVQFGHLRVRETNPQGSPACAAAPLIPTQSVAAACGRLLTSLGMSGAAMIEFRRASGQGADWLVEINPRLWGSVPLALHAGFDFPWWQLRYYTSGEVPTTPEIRPDLRGCRFLTAEIGRLINVAKGPPPGWEGPFPGFRQALREFLADFRPGWRYYHQSVDDPLPGLAEPLALLIPRLTRGRI